MKWMEKVIPSGSWDFRMEPVALLKMANGRLQTNDRRQLLEKRAADSIFAMRLAKLALCADEIPIHAIAIGATEAYGFNRNGDGFCEDTCIKQAHTFESKPLRLWLPDEHNGARLFYNHANKNPLKSYGYVKFAAYNPRMRRIELLLIANASKEAAARNGGLPMPDEDVDKLHRGEDLPWSMACKVAYDVCANCFHKAASRADYCTAETCINPHDGFRGLGCRYGLTKIASNGRQQGVENPNAIFFDMSKVWKPAERIAYGGKADYLYKAAAAEVPACGAALAEYYAHANYGTVPTRDKVSEQVQLINQLADLEASLQSPTAADQTTAQAFSPAVQPSLDLQGLGRVGSTKFASSLGLLADRRVLLTLDDFLQLATTATGDKLASYREAAARRLPRVYTRLAADADLAAVVAAGDWLPVSSGASFEQKQAVARLVASRACDENSLRERAQLAVARRSSPVKLASPLSIKAAAADEAGEYLARQYALYKVAFLVSLPPGSDETPLTCRTVALQNYIS